MHFEYKFGMTYMQTILLQWRIYEKLLTWWQKTMENFLFIKLHRKFCMQHYHTHAYPYDAYSNIFTQYHTYIVDHFNYETILCKFVLWNWTYHAIRYITHEEKCIYVFNASAKAWSMHEIRTTGINLRAVWIMMVKCIQHTNTHIHFT